MLAVVTRCSSGEVRLHLGHDPRLIIGMHAFTPLVEAAADLVIRVAEHGLPVRAEEHRALRHIPVPQSVAVTLDGEPPAEFAFCQGLFRDVLRPVRSNQPQPQCQIARQFSQQRGLLRIEVVHLGRIDVQGAEHGILVNQRENARGPIAALKGSVPPWGILRGIRYVAAGLRQPRPDRGARGALAALAIRPGDVSQVQVTVLNPGPGYRTNGFLRILLPIADPDHAIAALAHDQAAHLLQQFML